MKKHLSIFLLFVLTFISCQKSSSDQYRTIRSSKYKKIILDSRKEIGMQMYTSGIPGLSIAVILNGQMVWSEGLGYANRELEVPASPRIKYRIGGVSKMLTGALLAQLIEEDELDLTTPIRTYYPELPSDKDSLTLYTLAAQTSGIRPPTYKENNNQGYQTIRKGIATFIEDSLLFSPGQYTYETDFAYDLIGATIERKTGKYFYEVLQKKLTDTLHLESTEVDNPIKIIDNRSQCYDRNYISRTVRATTLDNRHKAASVGLLSSAVDMASLMNEYLHPKILKAETVKQILTRMHLNNGQEMDRGLGLRVGKDTKQRELYMSSGSTKGGSAAVIAYPQHDLVVAIACNLSNEQDNLPVFKIAGKFIDLLEPDDQPADKKE